ncbi:MAG: type II secretion system F family protein [Acidimicrobiales bacterium]
MTTVLALAWAGAVLAFAGARATAPGSRRLPTPRRPPRAVAPRGLAPVLGAGALALVALPLAPLGALAVVARRSLRRRAQARRRAATVVAELPDVIDLLALAVGAGGNVALAVAATAPYAPPRLAAALDEALARAGAGERLADALAAMPETLGDPSRPLVAALVASERYGTALLPALERLATESRADRRRRAEEAARRVPVALLFPLVLCVLPAFGCLSLLPLLAGALGQLGR